MRCHRQSFGWVSQSKWRTCKTSWILHHRGVSAVGVDRGLYAFQECSGATSARMAIGEPMDKPRIFLGSSGKQAKLLQALTRGLEDVARVEPWTTSFNPGTTTLERLLELTREVDFAAFVFAQDDWTTNTPAAAPAEPATTPGQASP